MVKKITEIKTPPSEISDEKKREACQLYLIHGNLTITSKFCGIDKRTLSDWHRKEWWAEMTQAIRAENETRIVGKLDEIIELSQEATVDRLKNGDYKLLKVNNEYKEHRVPMGGKDVAVVSAVAIDKRQILLSRPTSIRGDNESMLELMKKFEGLALANREKEVVSEQ